MARTRSPRAPQRGSASAPPRHNACTATASVPVSAATAAAAAAAAAAGAGGDESSDEDAEDDRVVTPDLLAAQAEAALERGVGMENAVLATQLDRSREAVAIATAIGSMFKDVRRMRSVVERAWTAYEASVVEGPEAVEPGQDRVRALARFLDFCAHCYQEAGATDDARTMLQRARTLADAAGNGDISGRILARLGTVAGDANMIARGLAQQQAVLGAVHPNLAQTLMDLVAALDGAPGDGADRCRLLLERALQCAELGTEEMHKNTAAEAAAALGAWHAQRSDLAAALPYFQRAVDGMEALEGFADPRTLTTASNLAGAMAQIDVPAAVALLERVVATWDTALEPDDLRSVSPRANLADLYLRQGDLDRCESTLQRACSIATAAGDRGRRELAHALNGLGLLYAARKDLANARQVMQAALAIEEEEHGPDHPFVVNVLAGLAKTLDALGDPESACPLLERAVAIMERSCGPVSVPVAELLTNLGLTRARCGQADRACAILERAVAIHTAEHGPAHVSVARALGALALVQRASGQPQRARTAYQRTVDLYEAEAARTAPAPLGGKDRPAFRLALLELAKLLAAAQQPDDARRHLERALQLVPGGAGFAAAEILVELAMLEVHAARWETALPLLQQAMDKLTQSTGPGSTRATAAAGGDENEEDKGDDDHDGEDDGHATLRARILQVMLDRARQLGETDRVHALQAQLFALDAARDQAAALAATARRTVPLQLGDPDAARRRQRPDSLRHLTDAQMAEAMEDARKTAEANPDDPTALTALGSMYMNAIGGLPRNPARAMELYEKAAALGHPQAMLDLAIMLHHGENDGLVDLPRAVALYEAAAAHGLAAAKHNLAVMLLDGGTPGVPADPQRAMALLKSACDQGHAMAPLVMANALASGEEGMPADVAEAKRWYEVAVQRGVAEAAYQLGRLLSVDEGPSPALYDPAAAFRLWETAAAAGHLDAAHRLAMSRIQGLGVAKDEARGLADLEALATQNGHAPAAVQLAYLNRDGKADSRERETRWLEVAVALDPEDAVALGELAAIYERRGSADDLAQACDLYQRAASLYHPASWVRLARAYEFGELGLECDAARAFECAEIAVKGRLGPALNVLARYYVEGVGTPVDRDKARELFRASQLLSANEEDDAEDDEDEMEEEADEEAGEDEEHVEQNDTAARLAECRAAADAGDAKAMHKMGLCYTKGVGVERNATTAAEWFARAAHAGSAPGMCYLAVCYHNGRGVAKDLAEAIVWFRRGADAGHAESMNMLAVCYSEGLGVPQDAAEAVRWQRRAADLNDIGAIVNLATSYMYGRGVPKNLSTAVALLEHGREVNPNDRGATELLARAYTANMQFAEAAPLLLRYVDVASPDDHIGCKLGVLFHHGLGVPEDAARAVELYRRAESSCDSAVLGLAECYELGHGVAAADLGEAARLYRAAAAQGSSTAKARCIEHGWGGEPADPAAAVALYALEVENDDCDTARFFLGRRYELGWDGVPPDLEKARRLYTQAAANGDRHARDALGRLAAGPMSR